MGEMGWLGTAIPETHGGRRASGYLELCVIAEGAGPEPGPHPRSPSANLPGRGGPADRGPARRRRSAGCRASRRARRSAAWPLSEGAQVTTPGQTWPRAPDGTRLHGAKVPVMDGDVADFAVVLAAQDAGRAGLYIRRARRSRRPPARASPPWIRRARTPPDRVSRGAAAEPLGAAGQGLAAGGAAARPRGGAGGLRAASVARRPRLDMAREYAMGRLRLRPPESPRSRRSSTSWPTCTWASSSRGRTPTTTGPGRSSKDAPELGVAAAAARVAASEAYYQAAKENIQGATAAWASPGSSTATSTTGGPSSPALMLGSARRWKETARHPARGPGRPRSANVDFDEHAGRSGVSARRCGSGSAPHAEPKRGAFETWQRPLPRDARAGNGLERARQAFQRSKAGGRLRGACTGPPSGAGRALPPIYQVHLLAGGVALFPRSARLLRDRPRHVHARRSSPTPPTSRSGATTPRGAPAATRSGASLFSEPGAGFRPGRPAPTRAQRDGDDWVINGQKIWTFGPRTGRTGPSLVARQRSQDRQAQGPQPSSSCP